MAQSFFCLAILCCSVAFAIPSAKSLGDIRILAENTLLTNESTSTYAAILVSKPQSYSTAGKSCQALGETLWSPHARNFDAGLNNSLNYEVYAGRLAANQLFWAGSTGINTRHRRRDSCQALRIDGNTHDCNCQDLLPVLCTQSAPASNDTYADTSTAQRIAQDVGSQTLVGYRDFFTFRFMGVRFAQEPERFTYSTVFDDAKGTHKALKGAPECLQAPNNGSTDCLFLNLFTTHLPSSVQSAQKDLRPVMVYIYGGGFETGSASNPTNDCGNLASRGDVVTVDIAYRLSTLGFLALEDDVHNGNYWISDLIAGLQWVQKYIEYFGGDPNQVTIFGESAGAQSVQALLASPKAKGLFHGAILQSNYFEPYIPISQSYNQSTLPILHDTGCIKANDQLACLRDYSAAGLINLKNISNAPVIDGTYLLQSFIDLNTTNAKSITNSVPVMMGVNRDEEGVLAPLFRTERLKTGIKDLGAAVNINVTPILASDAFPLGAGTNKTLQVFNTTTRIATDNSFHCMNEFIAYAGVKNGVLPDIWFYEFNRTYQEPDYDINGVCGAPVTPTHPYGDPELEYFKCHAGDLPITFGTYARSGYKPRDQYDKPYAQLVVDYWTSFGRTLDPNPDLEYLKARGYWDSFNQISFSGPWATVDADSPSMMVLQWNSVMMPFPDKPQCSVLGQPLDYLAH